MSSVSSYFLSCHHPNSGALQWYLTDIFASDNGSWISITSHSGEICTLLFVLNHRDFRLSTGQTIPVPIRAEYIHEENPTGTTKLW